jgi:UPF0176 protein
MDAITPRYKIAAFYRFQYFLKDRLPEFRDAIRKQMREAGILGTVILAEEGVNSTVCGTEAGIDTLIKSISATLNIQLEPKYSFVDTPPFRKVDVKIKPEIVTFKKDVDISLGTGTHISPSEWNTIISDPEVVVLDTRNDYEFRTGTFNNAINPSTEKFSDLPEFVSQNLDPKKNKKVAMFCTGGIRCEKFAPYMRSLGFESVFQLDGGILKYLEEVAPEEQLWTGECYIFDRRVTVDRALKPGGSPDLSQDE